MQNRYTGDFGNFSKLGLLRALQRAGLSIGLNWYLTPNETHNTDGRHTNYLFKDEFRACDEELWLGLRAIVEADKREVRSMETDVILRATFFAECLDFAGMNKPQRIACRRAWFQRSLAAMALKFRTTSQRYYMFLVQSRHRETVEQVVDNMLRETWGAHFCLLTLP